MNSMKRQDDMTPEDQPPRLEDVQYATGEEWRAINSSYRKDEVTGPKQKQCSVVDVSCLMVKIKSDTVKNNVA